MLFLFKLFPQFINSINSTADNSSTSIVDSTLSLCSFIIGLLPHAHQLKHSKRPMPINLIERVAPKKIKMNFVATKDTKFSFWGLIKFLS
ncbi:hypothetical protein COE51_02970 [Bacillus pseudomycoides]|nr:hypothetical protein COE51_02970 [Bacillus pseudomycoides]